jgi:lysozyme
MLLDDIDVVIEELNKNVYWWTDLPENAQIVIANMCFNIGWPRLSQFKKFWAALEERDYERAAYEMEDSRWFKQVKGRAEELKQLMLDCNAKS